jgi:hypothetical protein
VEVCNVPSTDEKHVGKNSVEFLNLVHFLLKQNVNSLFDTSTAAVFNC